MVVFDVRIIEQMNNEHCYCGTGQVPAHSRAPLREEGVGVYWYSSDHLGGGIRISWSVVNLFSNLKDIAKNNPNRHCCTRQQH